jgi:hypothetical protein
MNSNLRNNSIENGSKGTGLTLDVESPQNLILGRSDQPKMKCFLDSIGCIFNPYFWNYRLLFA